MKKFLITLIILFVAAILGGVAFWIISRFDSNPSTTTINPNGGDVILPSSGNVPISGTTQGKSPNTESTISTRDFLHASTTGEYPNNGYYYLGYHTAPTGITDPTATNDPPYLIEYIVATQYFNIELLKEPIGATRSAAQQFLMADLGISQTQMCQLNYMVSVPDRINSQYAGRNLGFSFCPGATVLPQ